ncbi:transposase [Streptomyces yokosukanensis]|uniref:transposase n=1 Tax=Streptomyces yokosukanensis TaxID=67386 RepID=UPI003F4D547B
MGRGDLSDVEWSRLEGHLPKSVGRGGRWKDHRTVINGIFFSLTFNGRRRMVPRT